MYYTTRKNNTGIEEFDTVLYSNDNYTENNEQSEQRHT